MVKDIIHQELTTYGDYCQLILYKVPRMVHEGLEPPARKEIPDKTEQSLARTRMTVFRLIACNERKHGDFLPVFVTLTFAKNEQNRRIASRELRYYHMRLAYEVGVKLRYIAIPEFQERGAIHYHVVYFNLPFIHGPRLQEVWRNGGTNIKSLHDVKKIAGYISKYVTKDSIDQRHTGHRLLITSRGLLRPQIYTNRDVDLKLREMYLKEESKVSSNDKIIITYVNSSPRPSPRRY